MNESAFPEIIDLNLCLRCGFPIEENPHKHRLSYHPLCLKQKRKEWEDQFYKKRPHYHAEYSKKNKESKSAFIGRVLCPCGEEGGLFELSPRNKTTGTEYHKQLSVTHGFMKLRIIAATHYIPRRLFPEFYILQGYQVYPDETRGSWPIGRAFSQAKWIRQNKERLEQRRLEGPRLRERDIFSHWRGFWLRIKWEYSVPICHVCGKTLEPGVNWNLNDVKKHSRICVDCEHAYNHQRWIVQKPHYHRLWVSKKPIQLFPSWWPRVCSLCGNPLPDGSPIDKLYDTDICKWRAKERRKRNRSFKVKCV